MTKTRNIIPIVILLMIAIMTACAPSRPKDILSQGEMEDILYDMHIAQALYEDGDVRENDEDIIMLRAEVLKKHEVTQAEWDSSYFYYCKNANELHEIYTSLSDRLQQDILAVGGQLENSGIDGADSTNIWNMESSIVLMQQAPYNQFSFNITPDSTFAVGDRVVLQCDVQMIFQDGYKDLAVCLEIYYDNDSINTNVIHINGDNRCVITVNNDVDRLKVKQIKGFMIMVQTLNQESTNSNATTLRLAAIRNIKLLHTHTDPPAKSKPEDEQNKEKSDSVKNDTLDVSNGASPPPTAN